MITILPKTFLNYDLLENYSKRSEPTESEVDSILNKALKLKGLSFDEAATLLAINDEEGLKKIMKTASVVKSEIYGRRLVLFAPLYTGNYCTNNCLYCGFRKDNKNIKRIKLTMDEIKKETELLLKQGHKRILLLCGESGHHPLEYTLDALKSCYSVEYKNLKIRRINVEIAPLEVEEFSRLKKANIGTYTCFQETYNPKLYKKYHPTGPKADYENRLYVMDKAMRGGIDDVGIGVLFGLADYKYEVLSLIMHAAHLENSYGCGPHTVSVPRIEPASGAELTHSIPHPVNDNDFKKIIAVIRLTLPYTGIILSTREQESLRKELFNYGVSQISAGSKTNPGGYSHKDSDDNMQFVLGDHRTLEEVISDLIDTKYIPSFCTGCYRKGRVGNDFMDLAKPGLIKEFCMPNGLVSFAEYLLDFASENTRERGLKLINKLTRENASDKAQKMIYNSLEELKNGKRDIYL